MKKVIVIVSAVILIIMFNTCKNPLQELILQDIAEIRLGAKPVVDVFVLTSSNPTNNPAVTFQFDSETEKINGWAVSEEEEAPNLKSDVWEDEALSTYTFSAESGKRRLYGWIKTEDGRTNDASSYFDVELSPLSPVPDLDPGSVITGHEVLVFRFQEEMMNKAGTFGVDTSSTLGTGTITPDNGDFKNSVFSVQPDPLWNKDSTKTLTINFTTEMGLEGSYSIDYKPFHGVCVKGDEPTDGQGTAQDPAKLISTALVRADTYYFSNAVTDPQVRVAGGDYSGSAPVVSLDSTYDGIQLSGGYSGENWNTRLETTTVTDTSTSGGTLLSPKPVLQLTGLTSSTVIDGFTFQLGTGDSSTGVKFGTKTEPGDRADAVLRNCIIKGNGAGNTNDSTGMVLFYSSPLIEDCILFKDWTGGTEPGTVYCIYAEDSSPTINRNTIYCRGAGTVAAYENSIGIYVLNDDDPDPVNVWNNVIIGNFKENRDLYVSLWLQQPTAAAAVQNNTMIIGTGSDVSACVAVQETAPVIENNIFSDALGLTKGYAVYEVGSSDPLRVRNNFFDGFWADPNEY